jgi:xanthine dehydrogenase accessory factor
MKDILQELTAALDSKRSCVFCSVIETRGSTPQKAGASMLVFPDGNQRGTLGGGCVEAEVRQKALKVLSDEEGRPAVHSFCLDDDFGWDDGLICGGRMTILADPVVCNSKRGEQHSIYFRRFLDLVDRGKGCQEAIVFQEEKGLTIGNRYLFDAKKLLVSQVGNEPPAQHIKPDLIDLYTRTSSKAHQGIAYLPVWPCITLVIVGAGHVGQAVAQLASQADFDIWVLDDRESFVSAVRFPTAQRRLVGDIGIELKKLTQSDVDPTCYALIVTRGHGHDEEALYHLAPSSAGYVGMIGSKRKIKLIFEDLVAKGISPETLSRVHAPLGIDIGSQTVPEIAISIVGELIAHRNLGTSTPRGRVRILPGTIRA